MTTELSPSEVCVVENISGGNVRARCFKERHDALLKRLGGRRSWIGKHWDIAYSTEEQLAGLLSALRDAGFAFVGSPGGWPPTAIFQELRDKGLLSGPYLEITWRAPGDPMLLKHSR